MTQTGRFDIDKIEALFQQGLVSKAADPFGSPIASYKYTFRAEMDRLWDSEPLLRDCRGLVLDHHGVVMARPFRKFFNLGEAPDTRPEALPAELPTLTRKLDGSLMIAFFDPYRGDWRVVTQGCWDNPQTQWAQPWLSSYVERSGCGGMDTPLDPQKTYLFELTAPWNRIVVLYPEPAMSLLTIKDNETGREPSYDELREEARCRGWECVERINKPLKDIDLDGPFANEEGFVAHSPNGLRVKLKYKAYFSLHKTLTGFSVRGIWESLMRGDGGLDLSELPEAFRAWYCKERDGLLDAFHQLHHVAMETFNKTDRNRPRGDIAREWAQYPGPVKAALFKLLDGRDATGTLWKSLEPSVHRTFQRDAGGDDRGV